MSTSGHRTFGGSWTIFAWLLLILSGALMTSLIRAPHVLSTLTPSLVMSHLVLGAIIAMIAIGQVMSAKGVTRWWGVMLVAATGGTILMLERAAPSEPDAARGSLDLVCFAARSKAELAARRARVRVEGETDYTFYFRDPDGRRVGFSRYRFTANSGRPRRRPAD